MVNPSELSITRSPSPLSSFEVIEMEKYPLILQIFIGADIECNANTNF
jgi:hypothetical protein